MDNGDTVIDALRSIQTWPPLCTIVSLFLLSMIAKIWYGIQSDIREMKVDIWSLKMEFQNMYQSSTLGNSATERVLHFLQRANQPSGHETEDISDKTSTVSSGSEDERIKIITFKRSCLAEAIQRLFIHVLRRIPFEGIIDKVVADQVLSVTEGECCRECTAKDDKMRCLIRTVMDKDFETIMKFLDLIGDYDPKLRQNILKTFGELHKDGQTQQNVTKSCTVCLIKNRVSIKLVCDHYFTHGLISSELHRDVINMPSAKTTGLWQRLFQELSKERTEFVLKIMKQVVQDGEGEEIPHHLDIIKSLDRDIQRHRKSLRCRCGTSRKGPLSQASRTTVTKPKQEINLDPVLLERSRFGAFNSSVVAQRRYFQRRSNPFPKDFLNARPRLSLLNYSDQLQMRRPRTRESTDKGYLSMEYLGLEIALSKLILDMKESKRRMNMLIETNNHSLSRYK